MDFNSIEGIKANGFIGFKPMGELFIDCSCIPTTKGVYMILFVGAKPEFLEIGCGPTLYKKKINPNISVAELKLNWVTDTIVVNIGKAGGKNQKGLEGDATLRSRLRTYFSFGKGNDVGHYGGRYIWQLRDSDKLAVCWKPTPAQEPREIEGDLIRKFKNSYEQKRPFANGRD